MCFRNTADRFGAVTKLFHWLTVVLIISLLTIGFLMGDMENSPDKFKLYGLHKSGGITVLAIALFWIIWRTFSAKPTLPNTITSWQKKAATAAKYALLAMIVAMPLTGWGMSSAAGFPVSVFGLFTLPNFLDHDKALSGDLRELHELIAYLLIAVISVHALAALLHHFYYKDNILKRMLPFGEKKMTKNLIRIAVLAVALMIPTLLQAADAVKPVSIYNVVQEKSALKFVATMNGAPIEGKFKNFSTKIVFSPNQLADSTLKVEVDTGSVEVANEDVASNIILPEWLSVSAFPKAVFTSDKFSQMPGTDNYYIDGKLTLRGKTVPVVLNMQLEYVDDKRVLATGYVTLRRSQFGVGQGQWAKDSVILDEVRVEFRIVADRQ